MEKNIINNNGDNKEIKKKNCKIIYDYLKEKCQAESIIFHNNREYFTNSNVTFECMDLKYEFNKNCFDVYPELKNIFK
jgi:hypothetical protein